jgi:hypothetical protein
MRRRYRLGEAIPLGQLDGKPAPAACRFEVTRPDGAVITRDWDKKGFRVRATQPGIWSWRMYVREGGSTSLETGELEVVAPAEPNPNDTGRLTRFIRRLGGR